MIANTRSPKPKAQKALAFTLVELLVAITIAAVLTVVALPRVREGLQQNVASRTATLVKSTFENARAQAIRTGRPYGIRLHRVANTVTPGDDINDPRNDPSHGANYCKQLSYVQMAFEYKGDETDAAILYAGYDSSLAPGQLRFTASSATCGLLYAVANNSVPFGQQPFGPGSTIRVGLDATPYRIERLVANTTTQETNLILSSYDATRAGSRIPTRGNPVPFAIETRPVASPLAPVDLPGKIVLDLAVSGTSQLPTLFAPSTIQGTVTLPPIIRPAASPATPDYGFHDVVVMFGPTGLIDSVYFDIHVSSGNYVVTKAEALGSLSFLIGEIDGVVRPETVGLYPFERTGSNGTNWPPSPGFVKENYRHKGRKLPNFVNSNAAWITIHPLSGKTFLHTVAPPLDGLERTPALTPSDQSIEGTAHPDYSAAHAPDIIIRNRLLDSRRFVRGQSL